MKNDQDQFNVLNTLKKSENITQRKLANKLGFSLGKLNYLLKALNKKRLIKINRFKKNKNKIGYIYVLTPIGISKRTKMALNFMKKKLEEYEELKKDISN
jgi:EPS-associated MarR family transcriptional regulator